MDILKNWQETKGVLLQGLSPQLKETVGVLLENQKKAILSETAAAGSTATTDIAGFRKILIPMIRRIIPGTIATEIVGVQPMQGPVGLVYSMRYRYTEATAAVTNGDYLGLNNAEAFAAGDEAFGNKHQSGTHQLYRYYSGSVGSPNASISQTAGAGSMGIGGGDIVDGPQAGNAWGRNNVSTLDGVGFPRGAGGGASIEGSGGRKMTMEVVSQAVEAGSRKLQAGWSVEAMQDLNAQHGLDIENEMTTAISAEIVQEIDAEILTDLVALAGTVATYNGALPGAPGYYTPAYVGDRHANLAVMINYVANEIGRKTRRGAGNFLVVSPMVVSALQAASKSVFAPATQGSFKGPNNTMMVGTLNGSLKVYSYLWNSLQSSDIVGGYTGAGGTDSVLVGYKGGNGETDSGYFYCPYIPLMSSGVVMNPQTYQPSMSFMTRYGKTTFTNRNYSLGNSADYYGKVNVTNMSFA